MQFTWPLLELLSRMKRTEGSIDNTSPRSPLFRKKCHRGRCTTLLSSACLLDIGIMTRAGWNGTISKLSYNNVSELLALLIHRGHEFYGSHRE
jgi:hypothetical protein